MRNYATVASVLCSDATLTYTIFGLTCSHYYSIYGIYNVTASVSTDNNEDDGTQPSTTTATTHAIGPNLKSLQFWHQLMYLLTCIISEDRERYSLVLNQLVEFLIKINF